MSYFITRVILLYFVVSYHKKSYICATLNFHSVVPNIFPGYQCIFLIYLDFQHHIKRLSFRRRTLRWYFVLIEKSFQ